MGKVLVIDDNEPDLVFSQIMLERYGSFDEVLLFETGQAALDWLKVNGSTPDDLIMVDINMPRMNGFEFLEAFDALGTTGGDVRQDGRVVMLSSSAEPQERDAAFAHDRVRGFICKPLDRAALRVVPDLLNAAQGYEGSV